MSEPTQMPDRLSLDPRSPHFDGDLLQKGVRINFNGVEKTNVEEYCVSEGWIKVAAGRSRDRHGNPMTLKLKGKVEPFLTGAAGVDEAATDKAATDKAAADEAAGEA